MKKSLTLFALLITSALFLSAQVQHGIQLNWTQSITPGITHNAVYTSPTKGGPYTLLFTSTTPITTYLVPQTTTNQGTFACFVVTATAIIESSYSNETCSTFPVSPIPPSGLSSGVV